MKTTNNRTTKFEILTLEDCLRALNSGMSFDDLSPAEKWTIEGLIESSEELLSHKSKLLEAINAPSDEWRV